MADAEWTGNAAQDPRRLTGEAEGLTVWDKYPRGRNHPNQPDPGEFREWMVTSPNSMVDLFAVGGTVEDTVTPPNPTPPTNISYWGETPPNTPEYIASVPQETYSMPEGTEDVERSEEDEERRARAIVNDAGERQDVTKFAPALGGNQPEAAGTEEVQNMEYNASGETTPVEVPIAVSAGVVDYTRYPNATHPSNPDAVPTDPDGIPDVPGTPLPESSANEAVYDDEWEEEDDEANEVTNDKPRTRSKKKKSKK